MEGNAQRRVALSSATFHPNESWMTSQAESIVEQARSKGLRVRYVQRDRDGKYAGTDAVLKRKRVKALKELFAHPTLVPLSSDSSAPYVANSRWAGCSKSYPPRKPNSSAQSDSMCYQCAANGLMESPFNSDRI